MMSIVLRVVADEWRLWYRSRLAISGLLVFAVVVTTTVVLTAVRMSSEAHHRLERQSEADRSFAAQPNRHPHRMVHYGHYVFRPPAPLAMIDPGIDAVTGESIFLEGHRQNAATFADALAGANVGGFGHLTPALVYQAFLPLLLIALGHGMILRERETGTLATLMAQGTSATTLVLGKTMALFGVVGAFLVPACGAAAVAVSDGESPLVAVAIVLSYTVYFAAWTGVIVLASTVCHNRGLALGILLATWLTWTLVIPQLGVAVVSARLPTPSKIETDLRMEAELRKAGDGHNASDPAFDRLRARLLATHNVARVEDLPVNIRGVVAQAAEAKLTDVLNRYAERRMTREAQQIDALTAFGWLSPTLALAAVSRTLAGTDLSTHHRFLREAEALRFEFVQGLNRIHAERLSYADDVQRSKSAEAERRTRVDSANWSVLRQFSFTRDAPAARLASSLPAGVMVLLWATLLAMACWLAAGRLTL